MPRGDLVERGTDRLAQGAGLVDHSLLVEDVDRRDGGRRGERMAGVGEPARVDAIVERRGDLVRDDHAAERDVSRVHALGETDEVRRDAPVLDREPLAAAAEPGHHLVGDQHDAVAVAEIPHALQVSGRWHEDPVRAHDRFEDHRRDVVWPLEHHHFVEVGQRARSHSSASEVAWNDER